MSSLEQEMLSLYGKSPNFAEVLTAVLRAFNAEAGESLTREGLDCDARERVWKWLRKDDQFMMLIHRRGGELRHLPLYADMADKVRWLQQQPCRACGPREGGGSFPIEVAPWTHQSSRQITSALKLAIAANVRGGVVRYDRDTYLCIRLVFVLPGRARMKDCDNMAKGLLDGLQGYLYEDDRQIDHLDVIRLRDATESDGYVLVNHSPTRLGDNSNVLVHHEAVIGWMTAQSLRLKDYLGRDA